MSEVKSLSITADTYRHRGWMWSDRSIYELFKPHMKLPLWIDRILTNSAGTDLYAVGKTDGTKNTVHLGPIQRDRLSVPKSFPERQALYNCRIQSNNGFRVLAERIRAKKPDANKTPRPQWRQPMTKPWEPGTLGGNWVVASKFVKEVSLNVVPPPAWADRLWVSTSANTDTFVWVNSKAKGRSMGGVYGGELHAAKHAVGIKGHQISGGFELDNVVCNSGCHWQLAGVRKKTVWVPEPEVAKPSPDKPIIASEVRAAQVEMFHGTDTGRVPHLNPLLVAPYGSRDIRQLLTESLGVSRNAVKEVRLDIPTPQTPGRKLVFDFSRVDFAELERLAAAHLALKPPIGVKPRHLHDEERANALDEAMVRYLNEDLPFPIEWVIEWNELRARLNKEQK